MRSRLGIPVDTQRQPLRLCYFGISEAGFKGRGVGTNIATPGPMPQAPSPSPHALVHPYILLPRTSADHGAGMRSARRDLPYAAPYLLLAKLKVPGVVLTSLWALFFLPTLNLELS